ncbi:hypothetical protein F5Y10DRAFT_134527 [Nemania abortiva]|nr:hypothetical protein F5Y10DRAFT_134527 [Nemania abortiva]
MSNAPADPVQGHPSRVSYREVDVLILTVVFFFVSSILVLVRFMTRKLSPGTKFWWDDWAVLASLFASAAYLVLVVVDRTVGGAGYHIETYSREQLTTFFQLSLAVTVVYNVSLVTSKASVLFLYERIFSVERRLFIWIQVMKGLLIAYLLTATFTLVFTTNPVQAQWKYWIPHTTIQKIPFYIVIGVANLLFDIAILAIPQTRVWKLHQSLNRRLSLSLVFLLGGFVCIASIVRITSLLTIKTNDLTFSFHNATIWTLIELYLSIICACLPVMPSAIKMFKTRYQQKGSRNAEHEKGSETTENSYQRLRSSGNNIKHSETNTEFSRSQATQNTNTDDEGQVDYTKLPPLQQLPPAHMTGGYAV